MKGGDAHGKKKKDDCECAEPVKKDKKKKKSKRKAQPWMALRVKLSKMLMEKENIKGGKDGFKIIANRINDLIKEAIGGTHKDKGVSYEEALKKAIEVYKKK